jgi:hypothetical protein
MLKAFLYMRFALGILAVLLAGLVGVVEFRAITDPVIAQSISGAFAAHDPFPRLPWDFHVILLLLFVGLLASGLHLICRHKVHGTSRI